MDKGAQMNLIFWPTTTYGMRRLMVNPICRSTLLAKYLNLRKFQNTSGSRKPCFSQVRYQYNNLLKILYIKSISHCFQYYQRRRYIAGICRWSSFGIRLQYRYFWESGFFADTIKDICNLSMDDLVSKCCCRSFKGCSGNGMDLVLSNPRYKIALKGDYYGQNCA